ncbi:MAG: hypothetical protein AB2A00_20275, partial [Myxococcota bacterium]
MVSWLPAMLALAGAVSPASADSGSLRSIKRALVLPVVVKAGVPADLGELTTRLVVAELKRVDGLEVVAYADIQSTLSVEQQKQVAGCDDASCAAEIAG